MARNRGAKWVLREMESRRRRVLLARHCRMTSAQEIRDRLEGYARAKIASVMQPLTEELLVDQPGDPIEYMVRYLVQNRTDLRKHVVSETLAVREEGGRRSIPVVDHPLMDKIEELEHALKLENKFRRKEKKAAAIQAQADSARIRDLEKRLVAAGLPLDATQDKEMRIFVTWETNVAVSSPADARDTPDFKWRVYDGVPPMTSKHKSLMKQFLKPEYWEQCQSLTTSFGTSLSNLIQAGVTSPALAYGIACGDSECPSVFGALFLQIARAVHGLDPFKAKFETKLSAAGLALGEERDSLFKRHVVSVKLKAVRNVSGLPFLSRCTGADREQVENLLHTALASLSGEVSGAYERLSDMDPDDEDALAREGLMLEKPEPGSLAVACGAAREWPDHRGVFRDEDSSVVCWVNGPEDHCTLWVMQRDHDVFAAFRKLCLLHQGVNDHLEVTAQKRWVVSPDLGFVSTCPSNLGTTFVIEVMVALPTGGRNTAMLRGAVDHLLLALEKMEDDEDAAEGDAQTWKLSHKKAFGVSELAVVEKMVEGIELLASAAAQLPALPSR